MKTIKIILLIMAIFMLGIAIFTYSAFKDTTWGGWKPPSTDLKLSEKESQWRRKIEKDYDCWFYFIGLDDSFTEDSIIHMDISLNGNSPLQQLWHDSIETVTEKISKPFTHIAQPQRPQKYIRITYQGIQPDTLGNELKYPGKKICLYNIATQSATSLPDD